jgi:putative ATPase
MRGHEKYRYPHDFPRSFVREQYLPDSIEKLRRSSGPAYLPSEEGAESRLRERLASLWNK